MYIIGLYELIHSFSPKSCLHRALFRISPMSDLPISSCKGLFRNTKITSEVLIRFISYNLADMSTLILY
jgi:hypothetical protein